MIIMDQVINKNNTDEKKDVTEISITEVLQAHDILISVLLGNCLASVQNPLSLVIQMKEIVEVQDVGENVKDHIRLMLNPLEESLKKENK